MPHQCVRCSQVYEDNADVIINGCSCGGKMFFFIKKEMLENRKKHPKVELTDEDKDQIEQDVHDIAGIDGEKDSPVILDIESIRVIAPGKYEIDLASLFSKKPLVYSLGEGKYVIDLAGSFKEMQ